jgi:hypothetical protein
MLESNSINSYRQRTVYNILYTRTTGENDRMAYTGSLQTTTQGRGRASGSASVKGQKKTTVDNGANFSTITGREIKVTPKGTEVKQPNFSDARYGSMYVPEPRQYSGSRRNNFSTTSGREVNVTPEGRITSQVDSQRGVITVAPRSNVALDDYERRVEAQAKRQEGFDRFVTEDTGTYKLFGATMDKPDVQNIRSTANLVTGGVNLNPFSKNAGMQTDRESRSAVGRVSEDVVFGALSAPLLIGGAAPMVVEKTALTLEAVSPFSKVGSATRGLAFQELKRSLFEVEKNEFSFLPGGTPINEAGVTTLASGVLFGALGARPIIIGTLSTSGARGAIDVKITSVLQGTVEGVSVKPPTAPRTTTVLRFQEDVTGVQRFTRGRVADTVLTIKPGGGLSRVTSVGKFRFELEQGMGAKRAVASEFKNGELVRTRDVPPIKNTLNTAKIFAVAKEEPIRSTVQPAPNILIQSLDAGRILQVTQPAGKGKVLVGVLEEGMKGKVRTTAEPRTKNKGVVELESRPTITRVTTKIRESELMNSQVFLGGKRTSKGNPVWGDYSHISGKIRLYDVALENGRVGRIAKGIIAHEEGHKFFNEVLKKDMYGFKEPDDGIAQEIYSISDARLIHPLETGAYALYPKNERWGEVYAEAYKARKLYPEQFKVLAPRLEKSFLTVDKVHSVVSSELGTVTKITGELAGRPRASRTILRVSDLRSKRQELLRSDNSLGIGERWIGAKGEDVRSSKIRNSLNVAGDVNSQFEFRSVSRGTLYVERTGKGIDVSLDAIQKRMDKSLTKKEGRSSVAFERPKQSRGTVDRSFSNGELELVSRTRTRTKNVMYVEPVSTMPVMPRGLDLATKGVSGSRSLFFPPMQRFRVDSRNSPFGGPSLGVEPPVVIQLPDQVIVPTPPPPVPPGPLPPEQVVVSRSRHDVPPPIIDIGKPVTPIIGAPPVPFMLSFGGGGGSGGWPFGERGSVRFKNAYSPSITGGLFNVKGTRKQANIATVSGLGVRPLRIA